jgi:hypothetical protein
MKYASIFLQAVLDWQSHASLSCVSFLSRSLIDNNCKTSLCVPLINCERTYRFLLNCRFLSDVFETWYNKLYFKGSYNMAPGETLASFSTGVSKVICLWHVRYVKICNFSRSFWPKKKKKKEKENFAAAQTIYFLSDKLLTFVVKQGKYCVIGNHCQPNLVLVSLSITFIDTITLITSVSFGLASESLFFVPRILRCSI